VVRSPWMTRGVSDRSTTPWYSFTPQPSIQIDGCVSHRRCRRSSNTVAVPAHNFTYLLIYLQRDALQTSAVCATTIPSVRPSVRLSVCHMHCVRTAERMKLVLEWRTGECYFVSNVGLSRPEVSVISLLQCDLEQSPSPIFQLFGANRTILRSLVLSQYQRVTDRQTDGRTHTTCLLQEVNGTSTSNTT